MITSAATQAPEGVETHLVPVRFDDPNDVGPDQLLRFELGQRRVVDRLLKTGRFDLVHRVTPSGYKDSLLHVPSARLVVGPVLGSDPPPASFQSIFHPELPRTISVKALAARIKQGVARRVFQRYSTLNRLLEQADVILAGTKVTQRRLPSHLQEKCRVVTYAGVEHDLFTPRSGGRSSRLPRLLFVGRLVPYKGVELLLRAAATALRRCKFELMVVGGGYAPYREYCQQLAADLQLTAFVSFVPHLPRHELVDLYRSADIFCMPSVETYGLAILEAMSSGCATLVSDLNGPGEIVQPGTGIKVPLETPDKFIRDYAERIMQLLEDANLRRELGERARDHVIRCHDWRGIEESWFRVYDEFLSKECAAGDCRRAAV